MTGKLPIAVFASGEGTNFQVLADRSRAGELDVDLRLLVSDKPGCNALKRAERLGISTFVAPRGEFESRDAMEAAIEEVLREHRVEVLVLAGYMRLVGPRLVQGWQHKMINLHPSLLPAFAGLDALGQALEAGVKVTGATVHLVDEGLDTGPIVAQRAFDVPEGVSREELERTLHAVEHELLCETVALFAARRVCCEGRRVRILSENDAEKIRAEDKEPM